MTVKELVDKLSVMDPNKEVRLEVENRLHYLSGSITDVSVATADTNIVFITSENLEN